MQETKCYEMFLVIHPSAKAQLISLFDYTSFLLLQMSLQALFLGIVFGGGTILSLGHLPVAGFGWYLCVLSFFHFSEFIFTALYQYPSLTVESFLLNHSFAYAIAAFSSWMEFFLELYFFPCEYSWCNCNCN